MGKVSEQWLQNQLVTHSLVSNATTRTLLQLLLLYKYKKENEIEGKKWKTECFTSSKNNYCFLKPFFDWLSHLLSHAWNLLSTVPCNSKASGSLWTKISLFLTLWGWLGMRASATLWRSSNFCTSISSLAKPRALMLSAGYSEDHIIFFSHL